MIRLLAVAALLAACDPVWSVSVKVRSPDDVKLENAALVLTGCPRQNEHDLGTVAELTDENGEARVGGLGDALPDSCEVTVAKPGFSTYHTTVRELCGGDTDDCDRGQRVDVTLTPVR